QDDYDRALTLWRDCVTIYAQLQDDWGVARALNNLGDLEVYRGHYAEAAVLLEECLARFRKLQSPFGQSVALINLGRAALFNGDISRAYECFSESLRAKQAMADREGMAWNLEGIAGVAGMRGDA